MDNTFSIANLPDDAECTLTINHSGVSQSWTVKLIRESPFRRLLEDQEKFQNRFTWTP